MSSPVFSSLSISIVHSSISSNTPSEPHRYACSPHITIISVGWRFLYLSFCRYRSFIWPQLSHQSDPTTQCEFPSVFEVSFAVFIAASFYQTKAIVHASPPPVPSTHRHLVLNTTDYQLPIGVWQHVYRASDSIGEFVCVETSSFSSGQYFSLPYFVLRKSLYLSLIGHLVDCRAHPSHHRADFDHATHLRRRFICLTPRKPLARIFYELNVFYRIIYRFT